MLSVGLSADVTVFKDSVSRIDQIAYFEQLQKLRPDLTSSDKCKDNLTLKPEYRASVLFNGNSYDQIFTHEYKVDEQQRDWLWAESLRSAASQKRDEIDRSLIVRGIAQDKINGYEAWQLRYALPFYVASYPPKSFIGYGIGNPGIYDTDGLKPKVFLHFRSAMSVLSSNVYEDFTKALAKAGFRGDSKIQLLAGHARFQFNNIVIHAADIQLAKIAEQTAIDFFGKDLAGVGRGFDVNNNGIKDWHQFLCAGGASSLPPYALDFVRFH